MSLIIVYSSDDVYTYFTCHFHSSVFRPTVYSTRKSVIRKIDKTATQYILQQLHAEPILCIGSPTVQNIVDL